MGNKKNENIIISSKNNRSYLINLEVKSQIKLRKPQKKKEPCNCLLQAQNSKLIKSSLKKCPKFMAGLFPNMWEGWTLSENDSLANKHIFSLFHYTYKKVSIRLLHFVEEVVNIRENAWILKLEVVSWCTPEVIQKPQNYQQQSC